MRNKLDAQIEHIAIDYAQRQGLNFSSQTEAQHYLRKIKKEIHGYIQQGNVTLTEGLTYLQKKKDGHVHSYVSTMASKLLKHLNSSKGLKKVIEEILNYERSLLYFTEVIKGYIDCGDPHKEQCVYSVLLAIFPLNPQAYICFGSLIWREEGIAAADAFYTKLLETMHDPALDYFAADCFFKNGDKEKAKNILLQALEMLDASPDADARHQICEFLEQL